MGCILLICWFRLWYIQCSISGLSYVYYGAILILYDNAVVVLMILILLRICSGLWINDLLLESMFGFSYTEQVSLVISIKLLIVSEWMLSFVCFWSLTNFRFIVPGYSSLISYPLFPPHSSAIPSPNPLILVFPSPPIQASQIFIKLAFLRLSIEGISQSVCPGTISSSLQSKEFFYSLFSISDNCIGSIFYSTTGPHGIHVIFGGSPRI